MATWTAQTLVAGSPEDVLMVLTEPDAAARWSPIPFDVDFDGEHLAAGDHLRARGDLAGRSLEFDVEVAEADDGQLLLTAIGPIRLDVECLAVESANGSEVRASITVSGRGLRGRVLAQAADAILASGVLDTAVDRVGYQLEPALAA